MASNMLSFILVFLIAITAIYIALNTGKPAIDASKAASDISIAEAVVRLIGNYIDEVAQEGEGSSRRQNFISPGKIEISGSEDAIIYKIDDAHNLFDYGIRVKKGNLLYITGSDVSCSIRDENKDGIEDIVIENSLLTAVFNKTGSRDNFSLINTSRSILMIRQNSLGEELVPENSFVYIDGNISTGYGTGYSELLSIGNNLPFCSVLFYIESERVSYEIRYRLYAGADFIVATVRNINYR